MAYRWRSLPRVRRHRASKPQGSSKRVLPWQITMDQLIFASLSHTHYWYEVGMLKVPAVRTTNYLLLLYRHSTVLPILDTVHVAQAPWEPAVLLGFRCIIAASKRTKLELESVRLNKRWRRHAVGSCLCQIETGPISFSMPHSCYK